MSKKEEIIGEVKEVYPWLSRFHTRESGWSFKSKRNSSSQNTEPGTEKPRRPPSAALLEAKEIYPWLDHWHSEDKGWTIPTRAIEEDDEEAAIEPVRTISQVPANSNYYVKDGLRTYGDGVDHETEQPLTFRRFMILTAMSFLWTGSQIPLYLFGGIIPIIMEDIGGADRYVWILLGNLMPLAAITPFVGALSDLLGRRYAALIGAMFLVLGSIVCATAHIMNVFIGGQVLIGIGAGICELTALAVAGEMAPTKKRGLYVGCVIVTILPYTPSVLYAQEVAAHGSWRWIGLWTGAWSFVGGTLTAIFFFPPSRANSRGLSRQEILKRLDWVGALLSTSGFTLFLAGLTWAGGQYAWSSPHVLWSFVLGIILIISFGIWEMCFAKYPMFPRRLGRRNPRALTVILIITAVSGANFFAVLVFWPTQYYFMYADGSPTSVGVGSLPVGFGIIGGSILVGILVTVLRGKVKLLMIISCAIMTAGNGAMAAADINNVKVMYFPVTLACLGVGAVIIPNQIIASIICPDDLIATITACTIAVRVIGGAIGYAVYYNVIKQAYTKYAYDFVLPACVNVAQIYDPAEVVQIATLLADNLGKEILGLPKVDTQEKADAIIFAGRQAFAKSYPLVYYASIAFGGIATIAALFLPDISQYMDGHVAVQYQ